MIVQSNSLTFFDSLAKGDDAALLDLVVTSSLLSILGSMFIIFSFVLFEESRRCGRRILFCLSLTDLCASVVWLMSVSPSIAIPESHIMQAPPGICLFQGYMLQFFRLSSYLWNGCFAFHLYQIIWKENRQPEMYESKYQYIGWGVPLMILICTWLKQSTIGYSGSPWCGFRGVQSVHGSSGETASVAFQLFGFYLPVLVALGIILGIYGFLLSKINTKMSSRLEGKISYRIGFYVMAFVLTFFWSLVGFVNQMFYSEDPSLSPFLVACIAFFSPLQGFLNAIAYGVNKRMKERYTTMIFQTPPTENPSLYPTLLKPAPKSTP